MGHRVIIGGTSYEAIGGQAMVDGTVYSIQQGRTMIGGTSYDIPLTKYVTITITGSGARAACVVIDGARYWGSAVIRVASGTKVECNAVAAYASSGNAEIIYNGVIVDSGASALHTFTADADVTIDLGYTGNGTTTACGIITITT